MKLSLKFKFTLFTSLLILVIGVGSGTYYVIQAKNMLVDELKKFGFAIIVQFAMDDEVRNALYLEQTAFLDIPLNRLRGLDVENEIVYSRVLFPSGEVFREEKEDWIKIDIDNIANIDNVSSIMAPRVNSFIVRSQQTINDQETVHSGTGRRKRLKETFYDFLAPVFEKKGIVEEEFAGFLGQGKNNYIEEDAIILGYVQIGLTSAQIDKKLRNVSITGIVPLSLITILGGFWVLYFIAKKIVRPISRLVKMTKSVAKGDLEYKVNVKSNDEIGVLAESFDQMISELKLQRDEKESFMTKLRDLNIELEDSNKELKERNEQLKDAQDQIVRSEKLAAVGQLASSVAHELRTPIGAINNSLFFIKRKIMKNPALRENSIIKLLNIMENEVERSGKIISDLLGFTQRAKPSVAPNKIRKVIEETLLRIALPDSIGIINDVNSNLPNALIDSAQIGQVFLNIIQNSCQAMPDGGQLKITGSHTERYVHIQFEDTGVGISKKVINKIFDPLFTTKVDGIGLGLAFSYGVVKRHGGDIKVSSEEGKGATFTVKLPINI
ncbi:MAG: ATP-binding protein [Candidatus Anammoxibacter sp.]